MWCLRASAAVLMLTTASPAAEPTAEQIEFFEKRVRPLLVEHCDECHGADVDEPGGGLRLTSRAGLLRGGDTGPAINPEAPEKSLLIRAVRRTDPLLQMPPDVELSPREVETLVEWVRIGAPDPREEAPAAPAPEPKAATEDAREWWSFQPVVDPPVPDGGDLSSRNPVDRF
ncbi:MAG TPA: c-type cytochrome domain-containing protein, partial [Planctomycetaceae bacterium]